MTLSGALRTLFPSFRDPLLHAEHLRFHTAANLTAMRWGLISAIVIWSMAWCMGMVLRPWHADRLAMGLACVLPFYAAVALVIDVPRFARHAQWLVLSTNITSGLLVLDVARYLPNPELVRLVGMIMVTFYAVLGVRLRAVFVLGATTFYNGLYLFILHGEQGGATEVFSVHAFLLGMAMVGALSAAVVLERNIMTLFRQRLSMQRQQHILRDEHLRSERLLRNILPTAVADQLKNGPVTVAERFDEATILFADLVDFTACSDKHPPEQVVKVLNTLFSRFDELVQRRGLEKIKTIGDAYMVAGGLPMRRKDHAEAMADLAIAMLAATDELSPVLGVTLRLRIGIHTGPVVAGVIGSRRIAYDVWGDTVNIASRLEGRAAVNTILVSDATRERIERHFELLDHGPLFLKGKGSLHAHQLLAHRTPVARLRIA